MLDIDPIFERVEAKIQVNDSIFVYVGKPRKSFFYQYVCLHDEEFYEPLSKRVDLTAFAEKVSQLSTTFVIVTENNIAGIVVSYFYDIESLKGFITLVHTKKNYRGKHLARYLIEVVKRYAKLKNFLYVDLVVYRDNVSAFNLYLSTGFDVLSDESGRCVLRCVVDA